MTLLIESFYKYLIGFFILGCTIFYIPGKEFYHPQEMFFQYGGMLVVFVSGFVKTKRIFTNIPFMCFCIYILINTILFNFTDEARYSLVNIFIGVMLIKSFIEKHDLNFSKVSDFIFCYCVLNVIFLGLQYLRIDPIYSSVRPDKMEFPDLCGMMGLKSNLGIMAAFALPFFLCAKKYVYLMIILPLAYFGKSSVAMGAIIVMLLMHIAFTAKIFSSRKSILVYSALGLGLFLLGCWFVFGYDYPTGQFMKRFDIWLSGIRYVTGSEPWFGHGLGSWWVTNFASIQENGIPEVWKWAHNEFIQAFFELGLVGFLLLIGLISNFIKRAFYLNKNALLFLTPILIISVFHFPFHLARFGGILCYMIASVEALLISNQKDAAS